MLSSSVSGISVPVSGILVAKARQTSPGGLRDLDVTAKGGGKRYPLVACDRLR